MISIGNGIDSASTAVTDMLWMAFPPACPQFKSDRFNSFRTRGPIASPWPFASARRTCSLKHHSRSRRLRSQFAVISGFWRGRYLFLQPHVWFSQRQSTCDAWSAAKNDRCNCLSHASAGRGQRYSEPCSWTSPAKWVWDLRLVVTGRRQTPPSRKRQSDLHPRRRLLPSRFHYLIRSVTKGSHALLEAFYYPQTVCCAIATAIYVADSPNPRRQKHLDGR